MEQVVVTPKEEQAQLSSPSLGAPRRGLVIDLLLVFFQGRTATSSQSCAHTVCHITRAGGDDAGTLTLLVWWSGLYLLRRVLTPRQQQQCAGFPHTTVVYHIPYYISYLEPFLAFLKTDVSILPGM